MQINTLHTKKIDHPSFYNLVDDLFIDGTSLNSLLTDSSLDFNPQYLIPTISCEIRSSWDREYIWLLLDYEKKKEIYFPILMCKEGDLGCLEHIIFVHIKYEADFIYWKKFGIISNAKKYTQVLNKASNQKLTMEVCSKRIDTIKFEEIDWFENGVNYKFEQKEYEALIDYYRTTNEEQIIIEEITGWLMRFPQNKVKEYLYILVNPKNELQLFGSNKIIRNSSDWLNDAEYKPKNRLILSGRYNIFSFEKITELAKISVEKANNHIGLGQVVTNYSSITFIANNKGKLASIKNENVEKRKRWWKDWNFSDLMRSLNN